MTANTQCHAKKPAKLQQQSTRGKTQNLLEIGVDLERLEYRSSARELRVVVRQHGRALLVRDVHRHAVDRRRRRLLAAKQAGDRRRRVRRLVLRPVEGQLQRHGA